MLLLCACSKQQQAPATPVEPAAAEPAAAADPGTSEPGTSEPETRCKQEGGNCVNKLATLACSRFEESTDLGCGTGEGCCFP